MQTRQEKIALLQKVQSGKVSLKELSLVIQPLVTERLSINELYLLLNILEQGQTFNEQVEEDALQCLEYYRIETNKRTEDLARAIPSTHQLAPSSDGIVAKWYNKLNLKNQYRKDQ